MQKYAQMYMGCTSRTMMRPAATRSFGAIVKADGDHHFLAVKNKKTLVFDGLTPSNNMTHEITNNYRHHNDLPLIK